jgi:hypothetical protein
MKRKLCTIVAKFCVFLFTENCALLFTDYNTLVSSASDNYLLPKLTAGWRPNQFIDNEVKPFLPKKE